MLGVLQARRILGRIDPAAVIAFGGYPSVAPVLAATLLRHRPPVVLHEQNAVLGRANRFLARRATTLALSFEATKRMPAGLRTNVTGNPVRPAIAAIPPYEPPAEALHLVVLGGSLGARVFSDVVPAAVALLPEELRTRLTVTQQCRAEDLDRVRVAYTATGVSAELSAFFPDVAGRLASAHLVVARAGASTTAELTAAGRPAILVPLPGAIDDHQSANARALDEARGAEMVAQRDLTPTSLSERLAAWLAKPDLLAQAAGAARRLGRPDAATRLADLVEALIGQEART
jgi:UDP-N-acetylglucosamine--N-acetylmuramyl-(pentapeptide) pyrophosphoryl-undecaprenol N-acetylglucosamine transferase